MLFELEKVILEICKYSYKNTIEKLNFINVAGYHLPSGYLGLFEGTKIVRMFARTSCEFLMYVELWSCVFCLVTRGGARIPANILNEEQCNNS